MIIFFKTLKGSLVNHVVKYLEKNSQIAWSCEICKELYPLFKSLKRTYEVGS